MIKIEKSNNPAAVGALVLVLALIVGKILWMVFGHASPVAAASTIAPVSSVPGTSPAPVRPVAKIKPTAQAAATTPTPETARPSLEVTPDTQRNPFTVGSGSALAMTHRKIVRSVASGTGTMSLLPLPPLPIRGLEPRLVAGAIRPPTLKGLDPLPPRHNADKGLAETLPTLKLTAIVGGMQPLAVVQAAGPEPVILHVGDSLDGMRVAAIHEGDVLFIRGNGFWTLPLQSAADSVAGSVSVTSAPAASQPADSKATPEETTE